MRELNADPNQTYDTFRKGIENENPEICANVMIGLIKVASYLLYKQIKRLEEDFVKEGGLRERMTRARLEERKKGNYSHKDSKDTRDIK
jgi:four helix bundle suffix protein